MDLLEKVCYKCNKSKPLFEYHYSSKNHDCKSNYCIACTKIQAQASKKKAWPKDLSYLSKSAPFDYRRKTSKIHGEHNTTGSNS